LAQKIKEHMQPNVGPYFNIAMKDKDTETANKIISIANEINWVSAEAIERNKAPLSQVAKNKEFMKIVEVRE
jgi:hypothetical protein